jgi:hypothetical protein
MHVTEVNMQKIGTCKKLGTYKKLGTCKKSENVKI